MITSYSIEELMDAAIVMKTEGVCTYLVAECVGGVMENPDIVYVNPQIIHADNECEAIKKYDTLNHCAYYHGSILKHISGREKGHLHYAR